MTLAHDVAGEGPAVVLLHAGVCDRRMWDPQWPVPGYRAVRCDLRGFGDSPAADQPYSDAEDVVQLMDTLGVERAAVIGASYGGRIALEIAARWPDRVTGLALLCAAAPGHEAGSELKAFGRREEELIEAGDIAGAVELNVDTWVGPAASAVVRERVREMQARAFELQASAVIGPTVTEFDLTAVQAPCLAVSGGHDFADFREIAARLAGVLPLARHVELPWAGHLPSMERPDEVTPLLAGFLASGCR